MRLRLSVSAVQAVDSLEVVVILHRLIEIHRLQNGHAEAGGQLVGDDDELQRARRIAGAIQELLLGVLGTAIERPWPHDTSGRRP